MKRFIPLLLTSFLWTSCSSSDSECRIENLEANNLKGNVKSVLFISYCGLEDDAYPEFQYNQVDAANYSEFDENGICTGSWQYGVVYDECRKDSYVAWLSENKPIKYIKWNGEYYGTPVSSFEYEYDLNGTKLSSTDMISLKGWVLGEASKPVSVEQMKWDVTNFIQATNNKYRFGAFDFSKEKGLMRYVLFNQNNKSELRYNCKSYLKFKAEYNEGRIVKMMFEDGSARIFNYDGNILVSETYEGEDGKSETLYENGRPTISRIYDTGGNVTSTTTHSFSGDIKKNGRYSCETTDEAGKKTSITRVFENGRVVEETTKNDSVTVVKIKYNEQGDPVTYELPNDVHTNKYIYDEHGNWIICETHGKEGTVFSAQHRVIEYYK